jgi:Aspartyl protease
VLRPYVTVVLEHGSREFETLALVDSGADFSMLPREVAEVLGFDVDALPGPSLPFSGAGSGGRGKEIELDFLIPYARPGPLRIRRHPFVVMTGGKEGQTKDVLLGRHPLFHDFNFDFRMGYTDDPDIGKFSMRRVVKRRDASRYKRNPPSLVPTEPE